MPASATSPMQKPRSVSCNGRTYHWPAQPTVVVCIDGSEPGYIEAAIATGRAPTLARFMRDGASLMALSALPSFTNPNNLSIITGTPPAIHGIAGNYFLDPASGEEVMMNDPKFLRAPTILAAFHDAGAKVAMVTAKDKLRLLLAHGLDYATGRAIAFSAEKADAATLAGNGIGDVLAFAGRPLPAVYSADLSQFVFAAGLRLLASTAPDLIYLSTTDYIQHKTGPGTAMANDFYAMIDSYLAAMDQLGAAIVATADHGMNDKHHADGAPAVIYVQTLIDGWLGAGRARVILPITDPYVAHHGALGSFASVYVSDHQDAADIMSRLRAVPGVELVLNRPEAARRFELPPDRIGDLVVLSGQHVTLGSTAAHHDLSGLDAPLRSHGGLHEQRVPMIANRKVTLPAGHQLRNFDAFDVALNRLN